MHEGDIQSVQEEGLGISIVTDIGAIIEKYAPQSLQIQQLLQKMQEQPHKIMALPAVPANVWETAAIHLLMNIGKETQYNPSFCKCLDQLIQLYLVHMDDDLPTHIQWCRSFGILSGREVVKTYLLSNTQEGRQYQAIESYLLSHVKTHLKKEEVAQALRLSEKSLQNCLKTATESRTAKVTWKFACSGRWSWWYRASINYIT